MASAWRSQLLALAAGFLLAVIVFRPWHQKVPTGPMLLVHPSAPGRVSPVTQLVAATGPVEVRGPDAADWCSVASATDFRCPKGTSVRTGPSVQCELQTASGGTVRLNDDTQIKLAADDTIEVDCGQIWCSAGWAGGECSCARRRVDERGTAQGAQAAKSWSLCCPADTCVLAGVEPGGGVQVGTTAGEVDVRTPTERRRLRPGESVSIVGGSIVQADNATDPLLATRWTQPLLIGKGFDNHDLADYVERLVAGLGRSDQSAAYEGDLRSLGPYAALPLIRYVRSPRSQADAALRLAVLRIACDTAPCWTIGELAELLADPDAESRYLAAGGARAAHRPRRGPRRPAGATIRAAASPLSIAGGAGGSKTRIAIGHRAAARRFEASRWRQLAMMFSVNEMRRDLPRQHARSIGPACWIEAAEHDVPQPEDAARFSPLARMSQDCKAKASRKSEAPNRANASA